MKNLMAFAYAFFVIAVVGIKRVSYAESVAGGYATTNPQTVGVGIPQLDEIRLNALNCLLSGKSKQECASQKNCGLNTAEYSQASKVADKLRNQHQTKVAEDDPCNDKCKRLPEKMYWPCYYACRDGRFYDPLNPG